ANEDELRREGLFGHPELANEDELQRGYFGHPELGNRGKFRQPVRYQRHQLATSEDDESGKKFKYIRDNPAIVLTRPVSEWSFQDT
ncbi:unnamed protein product, partial [Allacma fusca]